MLHVWFYLEGIQTDPESPNAPKSWQTQRNSETKNGDVETLRWVPQLKSSDWNPLTESSKNYLKNEYEAQASG